jgi:hypothetical protein
MRKAPQSHIKGMGNFERCPYDSGGAIQTQPRPAPGALTFNLSRHSRESGNPAS